MAIDFFNFTTEIRQFAPQVKTDTKINEFEPYLRPQKQRIIRAIGQETYDQILDDYTNQFVDPVLRKGWEYMQAALANFMAIPYFKFDAQERNNTDNNLFRYQETAQLEEYLENAWTEMDNLLEHLEANPTAYPDYQLTDMFTERENLFIKDAYQFQKYYGSNAYKSAYFYNSTIFLQKEIQMDELDSRFSDWKTTATADEKLLIGKIIAYKTMSKVCMQFDYTEMPKPLRGTIMSDIDTRKGKGSITEVDIKKELAEMLDAEARRYMFKLESARNDDRNDGEYIIPHEENSADNKFFIPGML